MNVPCALTLAGIVALALSTAPVAEAASAHKPAHHVARKATVKKTTNDGGMSVDTQDVNGDGSSDVVVASPPKPKSKSKPKSKPMPKRKKN
ncbi:MAG: hypothetical protein WC670_02490 [Pseudolabrys sp.]